MDSDAGSTEDGNSIDNGESTQDPLSVRSNVPDVVEVEIQNRFIEGELDPEATSAKFAQVHDRHLPYPGCWPNGSEMLCNSAFPSSLLHLPGFVLP